MNESKAAKATSRTVKKSVIMVDFGLVTLTPNKQNGDWAKQSKIAELDGTIR
jgi:hypothetical protein